MLEGLTEAARAGNIDAKTFRAAEAKALDFMLDHKLYRSDKTGEIIDERFTHLTYPSHWHYTVLRGLEYIRKTPEIGDKRLDDPIAMLESRRKPNGRWVGEAHPRRRAFRHGEVGRREPLGHAQGAAGAEGA